MWMKSDTHQHWHYLAPTIKLECYYHHHWLVIYTIWIPIKRFQTPIGTGYSSRKTKQLKPLKEWCGWKTDMPFLVKSSRFPGGHAHFVWGDSIELSLFNRYNKDPNDTWWLQSPAEVILLGSTLQWMSCWHGDDPNGWLGESTAAGGARNLSTSKSGGHCCVQATMFSHHWRVDRENLKTILLLMAEIRLTTWDAAKTL